MYLLKAAAPVRIFNVQFQCQAQDLYITQGEAEGDKEMKDFIKEFKEFAVKGNMIDLAVGMIIGSAFTALVKSVVDDLVMPLLSIFTGKIDFNNMFIPLAGQTSKVYDTAVAEGAVFGYGKFLTQGISFLIMAFVVFLFVKGMNKLRKEEAEASPAGAEGQKA